MLEFFCQLHLSASANLTAEEGVFLGILALIAWFGGKRIKALPSLYGIFLILYITLLRRAPGYDENIRLHLKLLPNAGVWAGNLLNLILYVPLGWAMKRSGKRAVIIAFFLSAFCELTQYISGRGMADVNDVLFNILGAALGAWVGAAASRHHP